MMRMRLTLVLLLTAWTPHAIAAPPRIAVVDFDTHQHAAKLSGAQLADYVMDELVNTGLFEVVEREKLSSAMTEIGFSQSGMVDADSASRFGRQLGAQYLLTGRVVSMDSAVREFKGYGVQTRNTVMTLSVAIRIMEVERGSVAFSTRAQSEATLSEGGGMTASGGNAYAGLAESSARKLVAEITKSGRFAANGGAAAGTSGLVEVSILSQPDGADVEVDGVYYGNTGKLKIPAGMRRIRISLAGHAPWEKQVMVNSGAKFTATLAPLQPATRRPQQTGQQPSP